MKTHLHRAVLLAVAAAVTVAAGPEFVAWAAAGATAGTAAGHLARRRA